MKKRLLLAGLLFGTLAANAQTTTLFSDGFETYNDFIISNIGTWTQIDDDGLSTFGIEQEDGSAYEFDNSNYIGTAIIFNPSATNPVLSDDWAPRTGAKSLTFFGADGGANEDWFITPKIRLGSSGNTVSFWAKSYTDAYGLERINVSVSTTSNTDTAAFTRISTPSTGLAYTEVPAEEYTQYTFNLDAYNGQEVYIAINYVSDDAFALFVDDFAVTTTGTLGLDAALASSFTISPNPANSIVNVTNANNALVTAISVADINGRTVKSSKFEGIATAQINVSDLASGVYMMTVTSDKGNITKKIVKN